MSTAKFSKLILHNFLNFRHAEINLNDKTTLINGMKQTADVLVNFFTAFKFMLSNNNEDTVEDVRMMDNSVNDSTYVEAHIFTSEGAIWIFRKTLLDDTEILYTHNDNQTTQDDFKSRFTELGFELSNTFLIDSQMIERIAMMDQEAKCAYIEKFCTSSESTFKYHQYKTMIENMATCLKSLFDRKKDMKNEEKSEKLKVNSLKKFSNAFNEMNRLTTEFILFELYYNNLQCEVGPQKMEEFQNELVICGEQHTESINDHKKSLNDYFTVEGISLEANLNLRNTLIAKHKCETSLEIDRQKIEQFEFYKVMDYEGFYLKTFEKEIDKYKLKLTDLDKLKERLEPMHEEYSFLKKDFLNSNYKLLVPYNTMKKLIFNEIYKMRDTLKFFETQQADLIDDRNKYAERMKSIESGKKEISQQIKELLDRKNETSSKIFTKAKIASKLEIITNIKKKIKSERQSVFDKLRQNFSYSIVGRLYDLFDVVSVNDIEVKHFQILERLGKYADAIVVDSQENVEKCVEFLKLQAHQQINEIIIPLSFSNAQISTAELMKEYKLPENVKAEPIESFIQAKHPQIQKLIMQILKPTIVTDMAPNLEIISDTVEGKIQVTTFESCATFKSNSAFQMHARSSLNADFSDETLMMMKENLQACRIELIELNAEKSMLHLKLEGLLNKKDFYDRYENMIESLLLSNKAAIKTCTSRVDKTKEALKKLENIKGLDEMKKKFRDLKKQIQQLENEHFKDFLSTYELESIQHYEQEAEKVFPVTNFNNRRKLYHSRMETNQKIKSKLILAAEVDFDPQQLQSAKLDYEKKKKQLEKIDKELTEIREQNANINEELKGSYKIALEKRSLFNELETKVDSLQTKICDELINIQIALNESFRLLYLSLVNCDRIPLNNGSLTQFLDIPDEQDIDENFSLIHYHLDKMDINFGKLDAKLKSESDVPKKKNDMIKKLRQLKQFLDEFSLDVTGDEQQLSKITKELSQLEKETRKMSQHLQNAKEEYDNICNERNRCFNECLDIINKEIEKFCTIGLEGKAKGVMKAVDNVDSCLRGVEYVWTNEEQVDGHSRLNRNYEATFAFVMGLIKYKKQQFVILNDSTKVMLNGINLKSLLEYLKADENFQVVALLANQLTSIEEFCNYSIMKCNGRYIAKSNM